MSEFPGRDLLESIPTILETQASILATQGEQMQRELAIVTTLQYVIGLMSQEDRAAFRSLIEQRERELDDEVGPSETRSKILQSMIVSARDSGG